MNIKEYVYMGTEFQVYYAFTAGCYVYHRRDNGAYTERTNLFTEKEATDYFNKKVSFFKKVVGVE